ncbi:acyl-CoA dehydrogenase family protein [Citricoccus muralis]|uniref:Acyl-CoA dehydrogenase family protein n=1 Tax=Citricoccus muralis TaxID=169134 RepID=A0ABY8H8T8_9MICC|nr:acyl-CoA dehydrogenase family protein [Citricoccus muralis]WFP17027.1 acyl-CoA dehydrogenase family protein [Citricoccus muralis]
MTTRIASPADHDYRRLREQYRDIFDDIARGELARETGRHLPFSPMESLRSRGFGALTVDTEDGGAGAGHETALRLLIDLAELDANTAHLARSQLIFVEHVRMQASAELRRKWFRHIIDGEWCGSALSEKTSAGLGDTSTKVWEDDAGSLLITGEKYYTTGTIFSTWTLVNALVDKPLASRRVRRQRRRGDTGVTSASAARALALVRVRQPRVQVKDDWDGFGQRLTGTGTLEMKGAGVEDLLDPPPPNGLVPIHHEITLLALMAGIGRAALKEGIELTRNRSRVFNTGGGVRAREDDQLLGIIGELSAQQHTVEELVRAVGRDLDLAADAEAAGEEAATQRAELLREAGLAAQRAHVVIPRLVLDICTRIFDTLGASATSNELQLDRHWRNARTLASHDPAAFMARMIGDWEVNRVEPVPFLGVGETDDEETD